MIGRRGRRSSWEAALLGLAVAVAALAVPGSASAAAPEKYPFPGSIRLDVDPVFGVRGEPVTVTPSRPCPGMTTVNVRGFAAQGYPDGSTGFFDLGHASAPVRSDGSWEVSADLLPADYSGHPIGVEATCISGDGTGALGYGMTYVGSDAEAYWVPEACYVASVYADLLHRDPEPGAFGWMDALLAGTPRIDVANGITGSYEFRSNLITGLYAEFLDREPDPQGLVHWVNELYRGLTIEQVEALIVSSPEKYAQAGSTDGGWVRYLYQAVLGRAAADSEVDGWTNQLARGASRSTVAMGFLISTERLRNRVEGYYEWLLGRGTDPVGRDTWVGAIQTGSRTEAVLGSIIASEEYFSYCAP